MVVKFSRKQNKNANDHNTIGVKPKSCVITKTIILMTPKNNITRISFLASIIFLLFCTGCYRDAFGISGHGNDVSQSRNLNSFTGVDLAIDANVILHTDSFYHVELHGQQNILNVISTEIRGNKLKIGFEHNVRSHSTVTIHVYAPYYTFADISGSGKIENNDAWNCTEFEAKISGSGDIFISGIQTGAVESSISGSGKITLDGTCTSLNSSISGSGDLHAFDLIGNTGDVRVSGSGKTELNVSQTLEVHISGSGDVYYKNNPALNVSISGSGQVIHVQ